MDDDNKLNFSYNSLLSPNNIPTHNDFVLFSDDHEGRKNVRQSEVGTRRSHGRKYGFTRT